VSCQITTRFLDAYLDGELPTQEATAVRNHLAVCTSCHRRLRARDDLAAFMWALPYFMAPPHLHRTVRGAHGPARRTVRWAAAAMLVLGLGGMLGVRSWWQKHTASLVATQVLTRHVNAITTQHLVDVRSSDQHTVKPWFQGKLDFAPPVFDLADAGFPLVGARIDSIAGREVAAVIYQRRQHVITTFVSVDDDVPTESEHTVRGFHERQWERQGLCFWVVSDLNADELAEFARLLRSRAM
jgi:anti-sigma factor RsiW